MRRLGANDQMLRVWPDAPTYFLKCRAAATAPLVAAPAAAMGSVLLALNVLGDGLRDVLDPKQR